MRFVSEDKKSVVEPAKLFWNQGCKWVDLGWRISDFLKIEKGSIDLNQETPISMDAITQKCNIIAKSFLSGESVELLKTYLPTLKPENPYLFQSNSHNFLDPETVATYSKD